MQDHQEHNVVAKYGSLYEVEAFTMETHRGRGAFSSRMLEKPCRRPGGRLKEAGFGWMLPGSRGDGDNSTRRYLNKSHPIGWRNEAKLKLELVQKSQ